MSAETSQFVLINNHAEGVLRLSPTSEIVVFNSPQKHISVQIEENGEKAHVRITLKNTQDHTVYFVDHLWNPHEGSQRDQFTRVPTEKENNGISVLAEKGGKEVVVFNRITHTLSFPQGEIRWQG